MTQLILHIENNDILPGLRKMLQTIKGVSIVEPALTKNEVEKTSLLDSIAKGIQEVKKAQQTGNDLPLVQDLIQELQEQTDL